MDVLLVGVANGPFAEFHGCRNLGYVRLAVSFFSQSCHTVSIFFFKAKKAAKYRFVYFFFM